MVASIMRAPRNAGASVGRTPRPAPARRQARRSPGDGRRRRGRVARRPRSARRRRRRCAYRHRASGPHQLGRPRPNRPQSVMPTSSRKRARPTTCCGGRTRKVLFRSGFGGFFDCIGLYQRASLSGGVIGARFAPRNSARRIPFRLGRRAILERGAHAVPAAC
jgi:hypothetical protein